MSNREVFMMLSITGAERGSGGVFIEIKLDCVSV